MKPLIGSNKSQVVADIPEVKSIIEGVTVCWGCLSETCMIRQRMSVKLTGKKMINKHCMTRKTFLGDKNLLISLQAPVAKDKQQAAYVNKERGKK